MPKVAENTYNFHVGNRSVDLNERRVKQLLNATSAREAYSTHEKGLWARFCDYFCVGSERKTVRELFNSIVTAPDSVDPGEHLTRFQKLASYASAEYANKFVVIALPCTDRPEAWKYSFLIENTCIYKSGNRFESPQHPTRKNFSLEMITWNIKNQVAANPKTREEYAVDELQTLTDDEATRSLLKEMLGDTFFSSQNCREIRIVDKDIFQVVFSNQSGKEQVLSLSNRTPTNGEFRGDIARDAFQNREYDSLCDLLTKNYGTVRDTDLLYLCNLYFGELEMLIGKFNLDDPEIAAYFSNSLTLQGAEPVTLAELFQGRHALNNSVYEEM